MEFIIALLSLVAGFIIGFIAHKLRQDSPMGRILMHRSDEPDEPPYLVVELYDQPEALYGHERVIFDVSHK